jgi:hypothetical protein
MMSALPPSSQFDDKLWPTRNQIKRFGGGLAVPGRTFINVRLSDIAYLVGDILVDIRAPNNCVGLQVLVTGKQDSELVFSVTVVDSVRTEYPIYALRNVYFERFLESYEEHFGKPGVPIVLYCEAGGDFYEANPTIEGVPGI